MNQRDLMRLVCGSEYTDWQMIQRPTLLHRFAPVGKTEEGAERYAIDEHQFRFSFAPDVAITMAFGLISDGNFQPPAEAKVDIGNLRTEALDVFFNGVLKFRETVLRAEPGRRMLPMPVTWSAPPIKVPSPRFKLVYLLHALAGPLTDYETDVQEAGMVAADIAWP